MASVATGSSAQNPDLRRRNVPAEKPNGGVPTVPRVEIEVDGKKKAAQKVCPWNHSITILSRNGRFKGFYVWMC